MERVSVGGTVQCPEHNRERQRRYLNSEKGRKAHLASQLRYAKTEKGREYMRRWRATEGGRQATREARSRYNNGKGHTPRLLRVQSSVDSAIAALDPRLKELFGADEN